MSNSLTDSQLKRQDLVDGMIFNLLMSVSSNPDTCIRWNIEHIATIRDAVMEVIVNGMDLMSEQEFYPYIEEPLDKEEQSEEKEETSEKDKNSGETFFCLTDENITTALTNNLDFFDTDQLAEFAGLMLGGKCKYDELNDFYIFIPDENYRGCFDNLPGWL